MCILVLLPCISSTCAVCQEFSPLPPESEDTSKPTISSRIRRLLSPCLICTRRISELLDCELMAFLKNSAGWPYSGLPTDFGLFSSVEVELDQVKFHQLVSAIMPGLGKA